MQDDLKRVIQSLIESKDKPWTHNREDMELLTNWIISKQNQEGKILLQDLMDDISSWGDLNYGEWRNPISTLRLLRDNMTKTILILERFRSIGHSKILISSFHELAQDSILLLDAISCYGVDARLLERFIRLRLNGSNLKK